MKTAVFFFLALAVFCGDERGTPNRDQQMPTADSMIDDNIAAVKLEQHDIDLYATRIGLSLITTGTGIRYHMLRNADAPDAKPDQWAKVNYRLELLNGDSAYASEPGYPESFHIGMDDVESVSVTMNGASVFDGNWTGGFAAREKVRACLLKAK